MRVLLALLIFASVVCHARAQHVSLTADVQAESTGLTVQEAVAVVKYLLCKYGASRNMSVRISPDYKVDNTFQVSYTLYDLSISVKEVDALNSKDSR
jgi:hypothetical protein